MVERKVLVRHYQKSDGTQVRQHIRKQEVNDKGPNQEIPPEDSVFNAPTKWGLGDEKNKREVKKNGNKQ